MDRDERARLRALCEAIPAGDVTPCCERAGQDGHHSSWSLGATPHGAAICAWVAGPLDLLALARAALPVLLDDADAADARIAKAERERDEARAEVERLRATVDTMQVQLDAHREWLATAQATGDEARAEAERLREQARVWRTLACEGAIASRDLGVIGATEATLALARFAARAGQHATQGAAAEREACAVLCDEIGDAAEAERDACSDDRSRSRLLHAGRMHGADECARAIRARGAGGGA